MSLCPVITCSPAHDKEILVIKKDICSPFNYHWPDCRPFHQYPHNDLPLGGQSILGNWPLKKKNDPNLILLFCWFSSVLLVAVVTRMCCHIPLVPAHLLHAKTYFFFFFLSQVPSPKQLKQLIGEEVCLSQESGPLSSRARSLQWAHDISNKQWLSTGLPKWLRRGRFHYQEAPVTRWQRRQGTYRKEANLSYFTQPTSGCVTCASTLTRAQTPAIRAQAWKLGKGCGGRALSLYSVSMNRLFIYLFLGPC